MSDKDKRWGYQNRGRYQTADDFLPFKSRWDFNSEELQNLVTQGIASIFTQTVDLSVAQSPSNPLEIAVQGRAFKIKGLTTATLYNSNANTGIETVAPSAFMGIWTNKKGSDSDSILIKNGDGFRGDFQKLLLFWPAQANNSMRIYIYKFDDMPWMSGDAST